MSIPELKRAIEMAEKAVEYDSSLSAHVLKFDISINKFDAVMKVDIWIPSAYQECNGKHLITTKHLEQ